MSLQVFLPKHCTLFLRVKSQKFSTQHFAIYFDPRKIFPQKTEAKAISSHLVALRLGVKISPVFGWVFLGRLNFQTQFGGFLGEILSLWNVFSVHHSANEVSLVFKFATYILFGEAFLGKPVSVGNVYNLKYTNLHQTRLSVLPGRRSSWRSQLFSRTSSQPGNSMPQISRTVRCSCFKLRL